MHRFAAIIFLALSVPLFAQTNQQFIIADYNVENWNWIERQNKPNQPKPQSERDAVVAVITAVRPDVLGVEEMGQTNDLAELVAALRTKGVDLPYQEWVQGTDPDRHVCLLSRFPIVERRPLTEDTYVIAGKSYRVQRGFLDVLVKVNDNYSFRALVAHLKSKRRSTQGDETLMRLEEARRLRAHIDQILTERSD